MLLNYLRLDPLKFASGEEPAHCNGYAVVEVCWYLPADYVHRTRYLQLVFRRTEVINKERMKQIVLFIYSIVLHPLGLQAQQPQIYTLKFCLEYGLPE